MTGYLSQLNFDKMFDVYSKGVNITFGTILVGNMIMGGAKMLSKNDSISNSESMFGKLILGSTLGAAYGVPKGITLGVTWPISLPVVTYDHLKNNIYQKSSYTYRPGHIMRWFIPNSKDDIFAAMNPELADSPRQNGDTRMDPFSMDSITENSLYNTFGIIYPTPNQSSTISPE